MVLGHDATSCHYETISEYVHVNSRSLKFHGILHREQLFQTTTKLLVKLHIIRFDFTEFGESFQTETALETEGVLVSTQ